MKLIIDSAFITIVLLHYRRVKFIPAPTVRRIVHNGKPATLNLVVDATDTDP